MGYKLHKDTPPMEREIRYLLYDVCVNWGFCIPPVEADRISFLKSLTADQFANDIIIAEGMNPEIEDQWVKKFKRIFEERFGSDEIDFNSFTDRIRKK